MDMNWSVATWQYLPVSAPASKAGRVVCDLQAANRTWYGPSPDRAPGIGRS